MSGYIFADYDLVERAGGTETAALFKGQHVLIADRLRAVKMPQRGSDRFKLTFQPERIKELFGELCGITARVAQALDSATPAERASSERIGYIETIHFDATQSPTGESQDYIVVEWIGGGTLADRLSNGKLAPREVLAIMTGVLEGLEFAHEHALVHGNLKPTNILLTPDGQPKIVDFGGNILSDGVPPRFSSIPYLSPEQLEPGAELDGRADLFSLTLLFYEMLTGRRAPRLLSPGLMPSRLQSQIPPACDELILQGLQSDPRMRFRSAREMLEQLTSIFEERRDPIRTVADVGHETPSIPRAETISAPPTAESKEKREENQAENQRENLIERIVEAPVAERKQSAESPSDSVEPPKPVRTNRRPGERRVNEIDGAEMLWVPAGVCHMGSTQSAAESPVHAVEVAGFWIYKYPITQSQYLKCLQVLREIKGPENAPQRPNTFMRGDAHANKAASGVRWSDARDYATWAGCRLPTEVEWEWAARGPEGRIYPWGDTWFGSYANVSETGLYEQTDVDRYSGGASWCGAVDLLGNVFEWCSSLYRPYPYVADDGREDLRQAGGRVLRGGSATTPAEEVRASARFAQSSQTTRTGLRPVKNADTE